MYNTLRLPPHNTAGWVCVIVEELFVDGRDQNFIIFGAQNITAIIYETLAKLRFK